MAPIAAAARAALMIDPAAVAAIDLLGPAVQVLTTPDDDEGPSLLRGTIPGGGVVPLHGHPDPETFVAVSGELEGLLPGAGGARWVPIHPGRVVHVPGGAPHAFRNRSAEPAVSLVVTTGRLARFFREAGTPLPPGSPPRPPARDALERFLAVAARYGHWSASPADNAAAGIAMPPPP